MKTGKMKVYGLAVALVLFAVLGNADASIRPFGSPATLTELQGVFDAIGSSIDAYSDQSSEAVFVPTGAGNSVASYVATVSWENPNDIEFGIYDVNNPSERVAMFNYNNGPAPGDTVVMEFDQANNWVRAIDLENIVLYDQSAYYFKDFGFYVESAQGGGTFYSEDALNPSGFARLLTYEGKGDVVNIGGQGNYSDIGHWYVAAEAGAYYDDTTVADFSDMVVQMESIVPIPEPNTIFIMCFGVFGLVGLKRIIRI